MADYIDREAAMPDLFCEGVSCQDCPFLIHSINGGCRIADYIKAIPSADVKPVVHGKWIYNEHTCREECSVCGIRNISAFRNFCPNCGADMREVQP